tara:strand:+ start:5363 stop:5563 length:201 start_codon:yes stop_codon:yes gene_type:complete
MINEELAKVIELVFYFSGFIIFVVALAVLVGRGLVAAFGFLFVDRPTGWILTGIFLFVYYLIIPFF